jgi:Skp family chaperone for outer membrane proteins
MDYRADAMIAQNKLRHFGILGMKWGVRRYQNADGSLTPAGRKRYGVSNVQRDIAKKAQTDKESISKIHEIENNISNTANELGDKYQEHFKHLNLSDSELRKTVDIGVEALKDKCTAEQIKKMKTPDDIPDIVWDTIDSSLDSVIVYDSVPKNLKAEHSRLDNLFDQRSELYKEFTKEVSDKIQNAKNNDTLSVANNEMALDQAMAALTDSQYMRYVKNHFEDYWIRNNDDLTECLARHMDRVLNSVLEEAKKKGAK